jgi:hypothetical protein
LLVFAGFKWVDVHQLCDVRPSDPQLPLSAKFIVCTNFAKSQPYVTPSLRSNFSKFQRVASRSPAAKWEFFYRLACNGFAGKALETDWLTNEFARLNLA